MDWSNPIRLDRISGPLTACSSFKPHGRSFDAEVEAEPLWPEAVEGVTLLEELVSMVRKCDEHEP
jgi:hypothetical protein